MRGLLGRQSRPRGGGGRVTRGGASPLLSRSVPQLQGHLRVVHAHCLHAVIDAWGWSRASSPSPETTPPLGLESDLPEGRASLSPGRRRRRRWRGQGSGDPGSGPISTMTSFKTFINSPNRSEPQAPPPAPPPLQCNPDPLSGSDEIILVKAREPSFTNLPHIEKMEETERRSSDSFLPPSLPFLPSLFSP